MLGPASRNERGNCNAAGRKRVTPGEDVAQFFVVVVEGQDQAFLARVIDVGDRRGHPPTHLAPSRSIVMWTLRSRWSTSSTHLARK